MVNNVSNVSFKSRVFARDISYLTDTAMTAVKKLEKNGDNNVVFINSPQFDHISIEVIDKNKAGEILRGRDSVHSNGAARVGEDILEAYEKCKRNSYTLFEYGNDLMNNYHKAFYEQLFK